MKFKVLSLIVLALVGVSFIAYSINAQKSEAQKVEIQKPDANKEQILTELRKSLIASIFYENLMSREKIQWNIASFNNNSQMLGKNIMNLTNLVVRNDKKEFYIVIYEYESDKAAKSSFNNPISYGSIVKYEGCGEEGEKVFSNGKFNNLSFRKGRFFVNISSLGEEETANRFAKYASEAIEGH